MRKLKPFDYAIIGIVLLVLIVGLLVVLGKNKFSKSPVEATRKINFDVMLRGVSMTEVKNPFKKGEEAFITIRNVPYTKLKIAYVQFAPKKYIMQTNDPKAPMAIVDDATQPFMYDFIITLEDTAKITKDGPVAGGNKIKVGMPIVIEGFNYRLGGTVSRVTVLQDENSEQNAQSK